MNNNLPPTLLKPGRARLAPFWSLLEIFIIGVGAAFFLIGGSIGTAVFFDVPLDRIDQEQAFSLPFSLTIVMVSVLSFGIPVALALLSKEKRPAGFWFGWSRMSRHWLWISVGLGIVAIFLTNLVASLVFLLRGIEENPQLEIVLPLDEFSWLGAIGMTVGVGILVPLAEEMLFRGVIHRALRQVLSFWPAVLISSAIFGLFHIEPAIAAGAAVLGGMCAWVYERSESIWGAILIHAINNGVKVIALYFLVAYDLLPPI